MENKLSKLTRLLFFVLCVSLGLLTLCSCGKNNKVVDIDFPEITFSSSDSADIDTYYKLEVDLPDGVSIEKILLKSITNEDVSLDNNNGFTPSDFGVYVYTLDLSYKSFYKEVKYQVNVADKDIPEIIVKPQDITIENGIYNDFEDDLSLMEVSCKNSALIPYLDIKVIKIEGNEVTAQNESGFESYLFDKTGEYTVTVSVSTLLGKSAITTYKITVEDNNAPVISIADKVFTWINGGEIAIPNPRIFDSSDYEKTIEVKKNNVVQSCEGDLVAANVGDVFDVIYTVVDEYQNQAVKSIKLYAMAKGVLVNDNHAFVGVIEGEDGVCEYSNGIMLQSTSSKDTFKFNGLSFNYNVTSNYKNICFDIDNKQSVALNAKVYAYFDVVKVCVGSFEAVEGNNKIYIPIDKTIGLTGIGIEVFSNKRICFKVNEITLTNSTGSSSLKEQLSDDCVMSIDFADSDYYTLQNVIKNGFEQKTSNKFGTVKSVLYSEVSELSTNGGIFAKAIEVSNVNYIELHVYAEKNSKAIFNVVVNENKIINIEASLLKGINTVKRYVRDLEIETINGLTFCNNNEFAISIYIDNINLYNREVISDSEIFINNVGDIVLNYNELFYIPELVKLNSGAIKTATVKLNKGDETLVPLLSVGECLNVYSFENAVGEYKLVYTVTDIFNKTHTKELTITANDKQFYVNVNIENDYFAGETIKLPDAKIEGNIYESNKKNVVVNKYYKVEGGLSWINANDGFVVENGAYIDVKYSVSVPGIVNEMVQKSLYIHGNGLTFDYEVMADGTYLGKDIDYDSRVPGYVSSNWSHDGKYSYLMKGALYYNACTGEAFGEPIELDKYCDTVIFYAFAEKDISGKVKIDVLTSDKGWVGEEVQILKGEHLYVVKLPKEFNKFTKFTSTTKRGEDFYIDSVSFDKLADIQLALKQEYYIANEQFELDAPMFTNYSTVAFTEKQINNAEINVTVKNKADNLSSIYTFKGNTLPLTLDKGEYALTYQISVNGFNFELTDSIEVTNLPIKFNTPMTGYNANEESKLVMPTLYGITAQTDIYYKDIEDSDWVSIDDSTVTFKKSGEYQLKYVVTSNDKIDEKIYNIIVRDDYTFADFELDAEGKHYGYFENLYESSCWDAKLTTDWSSDGLYSLEIKPLNNSWAGFKYQGTGKSVVLPEACSYLELWVNATTSIPGWIIEAKGGSIVATGTANILTGAHKYVIQLSKPIQTIDTYFIFKMPAGCGTYYVDGIKFLNINVDFPEIQKVAKINEEIKIDIVDVDGVVNVKYKYEDDIDYTVIEKVEDKFPITFVKSGKVTVVYEVYKNDYLCTKEFNIEVQAFITTWYDIQTGVDVNRELIIYAPTSESDIKVNIYYKLKTDAEWTEITKSDSNYKISFINPGEYEIKEEVSLNDEKIEKIYPIYVRNAEMIFDFETDEKGNHHGVAFRVNYDDLDVPCYEHTITDEWSVNGQYSLYIKSLNNSWAGYDYSDNPIRLAQATNKFEVWVNASVDITNWQFTIYDGTAWRTVTFNVENGVHKYELTFEVDISTIEKVNFYINQSTVKTFYIDGFTAIYEE